MTSTGIAMTATYDLRLTILSVALALIGSYIALDLTEQVNVAKRRNIWLAVGAIALGITVWAMHFIAMLAYQLPIPIAYDFTIVFVSISVAIASCGAGIFIAMRQPRSWRSLVAGGAIVGLGIIGMHFTAMASMRLAAIPLYEPKLVALSGAIAISFSISAFWLAFHPTQSSLIKNISKLGSAILMATAIAGMHYIAMAGIKFQLLNRQVLLPSPSANNSLLAFAIGAVTLIVLILAIVGACFNRRISAEIARAEALRQSEERFRSLVQNASEVIAIVAADNTISYISQSIQRILGYEPQEWLGKNILSLVHPDDRSVAENLLLSASSNPGISLKTEFRLQHADERAQDFEVILNNLLSEPSVAGIVATCRDITERKSSETALRQSEATNRALLDAMPDLMFRLSKDGRFLDSKVPKNAELFLLPQDFLEKKVEELMPTDITERFLPCLERALSTGKMQVFEYHLPDNDNIKDYEARLVVIGEDEVIAIVRDITERKRMEQALFQEKERAQVTLQSIGDGVITTDAAGKIESLNPIAENLTGWLTSEARGLPLTDVFRIVNENSREPMENPLEKALAEDKIIGTENHTVFIARDGKEFAIEHSAAPIHASDRQIIGGVLVFRDVTEARHLALQLVWQANHDSLTGLVNRRQFEQRLEEAVITAKTASQQHALCYLDLDRFKIINDTCGHTVGDQLLRQVTALFQTRVRNTDILARLGGDEFGLLLYQCPLEEALQVANDLRERLQAFRFVWQDRTFTIGVSIGLVEITDASFNVASVLSAADSACFAAKNKGRNRVHVYQIDDNEMTIERVETAWVAQINAALEEDRFRLYFQAIVPLNADDITGEHYEVLLRLVDETGQVIEPSSFLTAAERYDLMPLVDRWVIRTLFATQGAHYRQTWNQNQASSSSKNYLYAINLSGASLNDDQFINFLHEQVTYYQVPPQLICFEITETVAIANLLKAAEFVRNFQSIGCRFALDDFGSGMSSFNYLKNLPVDYLKIDGSFVKDIINDPIAEAMVEAINRIGHVMGIKTIAEFVNTKAILEKLRSLGVDYAQGDYVAQVRPLLDNESGE